MNVVAPNGIGLSVAIAASSPMLSIRLSIPGKPLSHAGSKKTFEFVRYLASGGYKCTRFDWAIDDFNRSLDIGVMADMCSQGNFFGARCWTLYSSKRSVYSEVGKTLYIGSPGSDKRLRVYDKNVESNGEINSIRMECQYRDDKAHSIFIKFAGSDTDAEACDYSSRATISEFGFVIRDNETLSRCSSVDWWVSFCDRIGTKVSTSISRLQTMVSDKMRWIEEQVAGTLALLSRCKGRVAIRDWLDSLITKKGVANKDKIEYYYKNWVDRIVVERMGFSDAFTIASFDV